MSTRGADAPGRVFDRHRLAAARLPIDLDAAQVGEEIGGSAMDEMTSIELRRDINGKRDASPRILEPSALRRRANEVAAKTLGTR